MSAHSGHGKRARDVPDVVFEWIESANMLLVAQVPVPFYMRGLGEMTFLFFGDCGDSTMPPAASTCQT
jgi:hypothetical protein